MKRMVLLYLNDKDGVLTSATKRKIEKYYDAKVDIIAICEGGLHESGRFFLEDKTREILVMEECNNVCKGWALTMNRFKEAIVSGKYSIIILDNVSFYGPFCSFDKYFDSIDLNYDICVLDKEIQKTPSLRNFFVFNARVINDLSFWDFWEETNNFKWREIDFKQKIMSYFINRGFSIGDIPSFCEHDINELSLIPRSAIKESSIADISSTYGNSTAKILSSVEQYGHEYKDDILFDLYSQFTAEKMNKILGYNFIISEKDVEVDEIEAAVFVFVNNELKIEETLRKIRNIKKTSVYFVINDGKVKELLLANGIQESQFVILDNYQLLSLVVEYENVISRYKYVCFIDITDCNTSFDFDYYFENSINDDKYIQHIISVFESNNDIATLVQQYGIYNGQIGKILTGKKGNGRELIELRNRLDLKQIPMTNMCEYNYKFLWVRIKALYEYLEKKEYDINVSSASFYRSQWFVIPEILHKCNYSMGTIINNYWAQKTIMDFSLVLEAFLEKTLNQDNNSALSVNRFIRNIKTERVVTKNKIVIQDRLVPIGLKEAFIFYFRKKKNSLFARFGKF